MRIFFIIDEATFFLPDYFRELIEEMKGFEIVGVVPLKATSHTTIYTYIKKNLYRIGLVQLTKIFLEFIKINFGVFVYSIGLSSKPATIYQISKKNKFRIYDVKNVNDPKFLKKISKLKIDIIVSSCSAIFKNDLLDLPKVACINRHSGMLPSYGGLFPVFQAMIHKEREIGVTVHYMVKEIDGGKIISQEVIKVKKSDSLFYLYELSYMRSVRATINALNFLKNKTKQKNIKKTKKSYYTFPKNSDWDRFFKLRYKFI